MLGFGHATTLLVIDVDVHVVLKIVVKFYDSINYYCMGTRQYNNPDGAWQDIVNVLQQNDGIPVPYNEEPQGEAVCFGQDFNSGLYTLSEARGASTFPLINHERL